VPLRDVQNSFFLFPHPDDELPIAGTMRDLICCHRAVHAAWLTSGDLFGKGEVREAEHSKAMEILGLDPRHIHLLRFHDQGLIHVLGDAIDAVAALIRDLRPERIVTVAFEGCHPDHDAANFIAYQASRRIGVNADILEYPLYNATGPFWYGRLRLNAFPPGTPGVMYNPLNEDAIECKHRMMAVYGSQWKSVLALRLASSRTRMRRLGEPYRLCPQDRNHLTPPPGKRHYQCWFNAYKKTSFQDFQQAVQNLCQKRSPAYSS